MRSVLAQLGAFLLAYHAIQALPGPLAFMLWTLLAVVLIPHAVPRPLRRAP